MMNLFVLTGWVIQEPVRRYRGDGSMVLTWRGGVRDAGKTEHMLNFEVSDPAMVDTVEQRLKPGETYVAQGEIVTRPYSRHGVQVADIEVMAVRQLEMGRHRKAPDGDEAKAVES